MIDTKPIPWKLAGIWNSAAMKPERPLKPRDYIYASEVGASMYDRYLKMNAVPYTNPPNERSRRKFLAGNLFEFITKQILVSAGIFHKEEIKVDAQPYPKGLEVHGRYDFVAGGYVEKDAALERLESLLLPDYLEDVGRKIIGQLAGKELERYILELKSVSSYVIEKVNFIGRALPHHGLQGHHYQRNGSYRAEVAYISRDDLRMEQFAIIPEEVEPLYQDDILRMSTYYKKKKVPPREPMATFDVLVGRFAKNFRVEWSPYLSHYGFKTPDDYRNAVTFVEKWNRCMSRYVLVENGAKTPTGKPIEVTTKNKEVRAEIIKAGYKFDELLKVKIELGVVDEEEVIE